MDINQIAKRVLEVLKKEIDEDKIPVEISARHVHLSKEDLHYLFGEEYELTQKRPLSQTGQFLSEERVRLIGPKGVIDNVAILGPTRNETQVEISVTDTFSLGVKPVLRESGDINESPGIFVSHKDKMLMLEKGVIVAKNHIHMNEEDAKKFNVNDGQRVSVEICSNRPVIFKDVLIRVNKNFVLNLHLDLDEGNACMYAPGMKCKIVGR